MPDNKDRTLLITSQVYVPDTPAVGQYIHEVARGMVQRGFRVVVYTSRRGYEDNTQTFPVREVIDGVEIHRLPCSNFGKNSILIRLIGGVLFTLQCALRGLFLRRLTDMLVSTSPPMCPFAAVVLGSLRRIRVTYWVMDLNPDQMIAMGKIKPTSLFAKIFDWLNRRILKRAQTVIALDRFMAELLNRKIDIVEKTVIMPPWPLEEHAEPIRHEVNPFREEHGLEEKFVLMYSGNHGYATPVKTVVDAALQMQDREDLVFLFIGGGVGKRVVDEAIEQHKPANLRSLPYQPLDQICYSLSAADVHLVTVGDKAVGVVHPCKVYGAMALSRPILLLGPDPCHVSDLISDEKIGWRIAHGNVSAAVQMIDQIRCTPTEELQRMGTHAAEVIRNQLNPEMMLDQFCQLLISGKNELSPANRNSLLQKA